MLTEILIAVFLLRLDQPGPGTRSRTGAPRPVRRVSPRTVTLGWEPARTTVRGG